MIADIGTVGKQDASSCRLAITGMSYSTTRQELAQGSTTQNSLLVDLAKSALVDDGYKLDEKLSIIVAQCLGAESTVDPAQTGQSFISANQLGVNLGCAGTGFCKDEQVANSLPGLQLALTRLQSSNDTVILLVLTGNDRSNPQAAVFVLRRLYEAMESGKRVYASVALLCQLANNANFDELKSEYQQIGISSQSIDLLTLISDAKSIEQDIVKLSQCFSGSDKYKPKAWCALHLAHENDNSYSSISSLVETILSVQQRTFWPAIVPGDLANEVDLKGSPFYFNTTLRPWFYPQIHPYFRLMNPQPEYKTRLRQAGLLISGDDKQINHLVLEECEDVDELKSLNLRPSWASELFTFAAGDKFELAQYLRSIETSLQSVPQKAKPQLKDLSFTINNQMAKRIGQLLSATKTNPNSFAQSNDFLRVAFVCSTMEEFLDKIRQVLRICLNGSLSIASGDLFNENQEIYWGNTSHRLCDKDKLAFVLPGLGAAYPNMLIDLCLHFPEIRAIFDFIDYISMSDGNESRPSDRIFSRTESKSLQETPASLAVMDSAVVTVLMAEWALFTLLLNLGIIPDVLLGSSTGEFAALTMSGAVDILKAAPLFYHLSTGMVRALPLDQLINLRSLKINAGIEDIDAQLKEFQDKVYLSANLSKRQVIITGEKESINLLAKALESKNISADFLPFAVPYHTPLVSGVVSIDNPDIQALQISAPLIESWSCSLAAPYPSNPDVIRNMSTELFSKPILFRDSIESLYAKGVRTFVEVGPRGSLAPMISETLGLSPHTSLAANRSDISAITQLHHVLAALFVNGMQMDLSYLYARRSPVLFPITAKQEVAASEPTGIFEITKSFQEQLQQLEQQVMAHLRTYLSQEISMRKIFSELPQDQYSAVICRQVLEATLPTKEAALCSYAKSLLTDCEMNTFSGFHQLAKRVRWLAGRIAAKESVSSLIQRISGAPVNLADIEIDSLPSGKPYVAKINNSKRENCPLISLTHKDGRAIAIAADHTMFSSIGLDLESMTLDDDIEDFILTSSERSQIQHLSGERRTKTIKKIWSAKEAVAKQLGLGLPECLKKLPLRSIDQDETKYAIALIESDTHYDNQTVNDERCFNAYVGALDNMILSLAIH